MAASPVSMCSAALIKLGDKAITSLEEDSDRARVCNALYPGIRRAALSSHQWTFARVRVRLAADETAPAFGYDNAFTLPGDCLLPVFPDDDEVEWKVEGRKILSDSSATFDLVYISADIEDSSFPAYFETYLTARLAAEFAMPITTKEERAKSLWAEAYDKLEEARALDGQQGSPSTIITDSLTRDR